MDQDDGLYNKTDNRNKPQNERRVVHRTPENYAKLNQETASLYLI